MTEELEDKKKLYQVILADQNGNWSWNHYYIADNVEEVIEHYQPICVDQLLRIQHIFELGTDVYQKESE
jgi:hypothetical protein